MKKIILVISLLQSLVLLSLGCADEKNYFQFDLPADNSGQMVSEQGLNEVGCGFNTRALSGSPDLRCEPTGDPQLSYLQFVALQDYHQQAEEKILELQNSRRKRSLQERQDELMLMDKRDQVRIHLEAHLHQSFVRNGKTEEKDLLERFYFALKKTYFLSGLSFLVEEEGLYLSADLEPLEGHGVERAYRWSQLELQRFLNEGHFDPQILSYYQEWVALLELVVQSRQDMAIKSEVAK